jgi:hypothetical protein
MSATGSLIAITFSSVLTGAPAVAGNARIGAIAGWKPAPGLYQLDLMTPGSLPREAMFRKQIRQMPNFRK